jgi:hypothetical protein
VCFEDRQPSLLGARLEVSREMCGTAEPTLRDGRLTTEIRMIVTQPQRHPCRRAIVARIAVGRVGTLASVDAGINVLKPPGSPAQPFKRFGIVVVTAASKSARASCQAPFASASHPEPAVPNEPETSAIDPSLPTDSLGEE